MNARFGEATHRADEPQRTRGKAREPRARNEPAVVPQDELRDVDLFADLPPAAHRGWGRLAFFGALRTQLRAHAADSDAAGITFRVTIAGAPWLSAWNDRDLTLDALDDDDGADDARLEEIVTAIVAAMSAAPGFYAGGLARDAGPGWLGVTAGAGREQTRVDDHLPVIISHERVGAEPFAATWFAPLLAGTIVAAASILPSRLPALRGIGIAWALQNPQYAPLVRVDGIGRSQHFTPEGQRSDDVTVAGVVPIGRLRDDAAAIARHHADQFVRTLHARYNVRDR